MERRLVEKQAKMILKEFKAIITAFTLTYIILKTKSFKCSAL